MRARPCSPSSLPRVRERGWQSPIPLRPRLKKPAIFRWEVFSKRPPTEAEFAKWMQIYWNYGVGLAFGLDNVIGVDLDWTRSGDRRAGLGHHEGHPRRDAADPHRPAAEAARALSHASPASSSGESLWRLRTVHPVGPVCRRRHSSGYRAALSLGRPRRPRRSGQRTCRSSPASRSSR